MEDNDYNKLFEELIANLHMPPFEEDEVREVDEVVVEVSEMSLADLSDTASHLSEAALWLSAYVAEGLDTEALGEELEIPTSLFPLLEQIDELASTLVDILSDCDCEACQKRKEENE